MATDTRDRLLVAAHACLLKDGHANLSTRRVADRAGVPLSQIHYHFGGKRGLLLAMLARENERLLDRQAKMYATDVPLWKRYQQACDYLEEDLASGYVRTLQEMIAAGWTDPAISAQVTGMLQGWFALLEEVVTEAGSDFDGFGPFRARDIATLVGLSFLGGESLLVLDNSWTRNVLTALRSITTALKASAISKGAAESKTAR